jgi:mono/diheme cytochrome c family protein
MRLRSFLLLLFGLLMTVGLCRLGLAQSPTYGLGKTPTPEEIRAWDIAVSPDGKELPPGSGTAKEGAPLYAQKCAACHGASGSGGRAPQLIRSESTSETPAAGRQPPCLSPCIRGANVMAIHSPYATTIWDYINRGMPFAKEGSLKPDEVYALTAFLLFKNGVIPEDQLVDNRSLPQIKMPNRDGYVLPDWKHGTPRPFPNKP